MVSGVDNPLKGRRMRGSDVSDKEKKARGTFKADRSKAHYDEAKAAVILSGPWLQAIPEPSLPLTDAGRRVYDQVARLLFDQQKLTTFTHRLLENYSLLEQQKTRLLQEGKLPTMALMKESSRLLIALGIAENAPTIAANGQKESKFARCGFSVRVPAQA
jgi:hypothetical protein